MPLQRRHEGANKNLTVWMTAEIHAALLAVASDEERSMTSHIIYLIRRDLEQRTVVDKPSIRRIV